MLFTYKVIDNTGAEREGSIEALSVDVAISSLQKRGLVVQTIKSNEAKKSLLDLSFFEGISNKEMVILSRQLAILFEAQVSALRIFRLIAAESENALLRRSLIEIADDIQGGSAISRALEKHPKIFSTFYVNMVRSGEESGKLNDIFMYLADYLERNFAVSSKAKNALIYPAFVIGMFFAVMILMFLVVIPKIGAILVDSGQALPVYTSIILDISHAMVSYGIYLLIVIIIAVAAFLRYIRTPVGRTAVDQIQLQIPFVGTLYNKLYLSRITDNMDTMLSSGISMIKALEITQSIVGNQVYAALLGNCIESVRGGKPFSEALSQFPQIPGMMVQMIKVGEETGELGTILKTMSRFYEREVINAVDTLVDLIEPVMIVVLGVGVGFLLAAVIVPIYNLAGSF